MSARNVSLEDRLLRAIVGRAKRRFAVDCGSYPGAVQRRLKLGARRFADSFSEREPADLLAELREEALDVGAWALLALQRLAAEPGGVPERVQDDLLRCALLGAVADYYAQRAGRRLREGRP